MWGIWSEAGHVWQPCNTWHSAISDKLMMIWWQFHDDLMTISWWSDDNFMMIMLIWWEPYEDLDDIMMSVWWSWWFDNRHAMTLVISCHGFWWWYYIWTAIKMIGSHGGGKRIFGKLNIFSGFLYFDDDELVAGKGQLKMQLSISSTRWS